MNIEYDRSDLHCFECGAQLMPGPRGGAAQNYYCSNRETCRKGFNLTIYNGSAALVQDIGEVDDKRYQFYASGADLGSA